VGISYVNIAPLAVVASVALMAYAPTHGETIGILCAVLVCVGLMQETRNHPTH
jgi:hypothetical protein